MSEGFLSRWSRRKREAEPDDDATEPRRDEQTAAGRDDAPQTGEAESPTEAAPPAGNEPVPFDPASLPPLESIGAGTDIRSFLMPGVPAALTRAALRRVWSADPAIRDFVGLAENSWDFNAPDSLPGFASSLPPEEAKKILSHFLGERDPLPESDASVDEQAAVASGIADQQGDIVHANEAASTASDATNIKADGSPDDVAAHKGHGRSAEEKAKGGEDVALIRPGHGAALPD